MTSSAPKHSVLWLSRRRYSSRRPAQVSSFTSLETIGRAFGPLTNDNRPGRTTERTGNV